MKRQYEELRKKYDLPEYDVLAKNFEIDSISKDDNIIREILKKVFDKIDFYTRTMESLIQPDVGYSCMKEASGLNSADMSNVNKLYIQGMYIIRKFSEFGVEYNEKEAANFLKEIIVEWESIKPELKRILNKLKMIWKKQHTSKQDRGYLG